MATIVFGTSNAVSHRENLKTVLAVAATTDGEHSVSYSITGGADQAKFALTNITGAAVLSFVDAPDFENPGDADTDNAYVVEVTADDANGSTAVQTITVSVTNVEDALEKVEALAEAVAADVANLTLATNALEADKADKTALDLATQAITDLETNFTTLSAKVDLADGETVSEAIETAVSDLESKLLNGVAVEFDTFKEVADQFAANGDLIATLQNVGAGAIRFDIAQVLTAAQKTRARWNMGAASEVEFQEFKASIGNNATFDPVSAYTSKRDADIAAG